VPVPNSLMPTGASLKTPNRNLGHWFNTCELTQPTYNSTTDQITAPGTNYSTTCSHGDTTPAWQQMLPNQLIEWSPYMHGVRYVGVHRLDASIKKETQIKERFNLTYRADFINAFNSIEWFQLMDITYNDAGGFGAVGKPSANIPICDPRVIEMSLQIKF
jgi:hypothetical protein